MLLLILSLAFLLAGCIALVLAGELQSTVSFVVDKGGLWLKYSTGIGRLRFSGYQIRIMPDHAPRAWKLKPLLGRYRPEEVRRVFERTKSKRWKPIQLTVRSAFDIGVRIIIRELDVKAKIGIENDAAATAFACGLINTLLQVVRVASTRGEFMPRGAVAVQPVFNKARLSVRFKCILAIKVRHIIREMIENRTRRQGDGKSSD